MPGLYFHIPFCKQACHYCDFHFSTLLSGRSDMIAAMKQEIILRKDYLGTKKISSIYFGGGTPSLLSGEELNELMDTVKNLFEIDGGAEITLEANPDDLSEDKLKEIHDAGINRLSIGIQSFSDTDLKFMNRAHNAEEAKTVLKKARAAGFENITIDLIYGVPTLSDEQWINNMETAFAMDIPHLSCYSLTIEPKTALAKMIRDKKVPPPDEEISARHFEMLMDRAASAGFEHYEISNFARNKKYAKHNTSYWFGEPYIGIGPSSHSFDRSSRQWNISNNSVYIRSLQEGTIPAEREVLSEIEKFNEFVLVSLRTMWGLDTIKMKSEFGMDATENFIRMTEEHVLGGFLEMKNEIVMLTREGKLFADSIAGELFR